MQATELRICLSTSKRGGENWNITKTKCLEVGLFPHQNERVENMESHSNREGMLFSAHQRMDWTLPWSRAKTETEIAVSVVKQKKTSSNPSLKALKCWGLLSLSSARTAPKFLPSMVLPHLSELTPDHCRLTLPQDRCHSSTECLLVPWWIAVNDHSSFSCKASSW